MCDAVYHRSAVPVGRQGRKGNWRNSNEEPSCVVQTFKDSVKEDSKKPELLQVAVLRSGKVVKELSADYGEKVLF